MTAGQGILHIERPPEFLVAKGGLFHGIQLWVNLPAANKWNPPRYQDLRAGEAVLLTTPDGGALLRVIAGNVAGHEGPGSTFTPIAFVHATISPGAELDLPWPAEFNALAYVLSGDGSVGSERRPLSSHQLAVFGPGDALQVRADPGQEGRHPGMEVLILGGLPIREPVVHYGPFVMNTREEIIQAVEDFQKGRLGQIPAEPLPHHHAGDADLGPGHTA
jgi:redox-sensitive bicupin YhaK (pirin superfamily)